MTIDLSKSTDKTRLTLIFSDGVRRTRVVTLRKFLYQPEKAFNFRQKRYLDGKCARCRKPRRKGFSTCLECGIKAAEVRKNWTERRKQNDRIQN